MLQCCYLTVLCVILFLLSGGQTNVSAQSCVRFASPVAEQVIVSPVCTLTIETESCERRVKKVEFGARYFPTQSDTATVQSLETMTKPPYNFLWDITKIPNQVFSGVTLFADVTFSNDNVESIRREGVFCIHQPIQRPVYEVSYDFPGTKKIGEKAISFSSNRTNLRIRASIYWNERDLTFVIDVRDPLFTLKMTRDQMAATGVEILIDPVKSRKPYPGKDVFIYSIPLNGKPYRIGYQHTSDDSGGFKLAATTLSCDIPTDVIKSEGKGFLIYFPLPAGTFGNRVPETIGANIVVKTLSSKNDVVRSSWVAANKYDTYSPYLWGELQLQYKSIFMNRTLITLLFFGAGFLVTLMVASVIMVVMRPDTKKTGIQSEADRQQFLQMKELFDRNVTSKNVTSEVIGKAVSMSPKKLSLLVKQATGMSFLTYVMFARIEIAKERLRSSHASEEAIAGACGFASVNEMEKFFMRFCHTTPAKFRAEQQVT